jgi:hypothetical protein
VCVCVCVVGVTDTGHEKALSKLKKQLQDLEKDVSREDRKCVRWHIRIANVHVKTHAPVLPSMTEPWCPWYALCHTKYVNRVRHVCVCVCARARRAKQRQLDVQKFKEELLRYEREFPHVIRDKVRRACVCVCVCAKEGARAAV